jgi:cell division protein ZapA
MPMIQVTIAGRSYRMACGEGEEAHLEGVAAAFEAKIAELRGSFGEIGDMRLHVMAAVMVADDFTETKRKLEAIESEVASLRAQAASSEERASARDAQLADALTKTAERIERVAKSLNTPLNATSEA